MLALLYHNTREYFLLVDRELKVRMYNRTTWEQVKLHMGFEIARGIPVLQFSEPARHKELLELYEDVLRGEARETYVDVTSQHDGVLHSLHNFFLPARDESGEIVAVMIIAHDISDLKRTERALSRSEEQWRFALEGSNLGLWDRDLSDNKIYFSPSYHRLYGFPEGSLRTDAKELTERIHPADAAIVDAALKRHISGETSMYEATFRIRDAQDQYRWIQARGMIVSRDESGRPLRMIGTHADVTAAIEAEKRLQLSEQKYRLLFDSNPLPCLIVEAGSLEVLRCNAEATRVYSNGGSPIGRSLYELWRGDQSGSELKRRLDLPRSLPQRMTWHYQDDGRHVHIEVYSELIQYDDREARLILVKDITEQIDAEIALHRSHERYVLATRATSDALYDWDLKHNELHWGEGLLTLFGYELDELNIDGWEAAIHPDERRKVTASLDELLQNRERDFWKFEYRFRGKDGRYRNVLDRCYVLRNASGVATRMIGAMQDITEQKEQERALLQSELDRQKQISQATIETQERERSDIGKELHDNVNQLLTTTKLYLDLAMSNTALREELLQKSSKNVITVINEIRQLSRSLMNPSLGDLGLLEAIQDLAESVQLTRRLEVTVEADPAVETLLLETQKLAIFRILQEAINNVLRHAKAAQLRIRLSAENGNVVLRVQDDGIGFEPVQVKKGAGLRNMENRVYLANGTLLVESTPGRGCTLIVQLPMKT
ncbi:hypothetical protein GCM10028786_05680 [Flaviaesturariibacter terrae]